MAAAPELGRASNVELTALPREVEATRELYERYSRQLLGYCHKRLGSREEAEDAVQTTFLNVFRGLRRGVRPQAESAWVYKIADNVCLMRRRSSHRRGRVETPRDLQSLQDVIPHPSSGPREELVPLQSALAALSPNQRQAILMREWQGLSYQEIGRELGLSQSAVETLIFRARRALARALEEAPTPAARRALDLGSLLAALKGLFTGGAAVKVAATAAVVSTVVVAGGSTGLPRPSAPAPATVTPAPAAPATQARSTPTTPVIGVGSRAPVADRRVAKLASPGSKPAAQETRGVGGPTAAGAGTTAPAPPDAPTAAAPAAPPTAPAPPAAPVGQVGDVGGVAPPKPVPQAPVPPLPVVPEVEVPQPPPLPDLPVDLNPPPLPVPVPPLPDVASPELPPLPPLPPTP